MNLDALNIRNTPVSYSYIVAVYCKTSQYGTGTGPYGRLNFIVHAIISTLFVYISIYNRITPINSLVAAACIFIYTNKINHTINLLGTLLQCFLHPLLKYSPLDSQTRASFYDARYTL